MPVTKEERYQASKKVTFVGAGVNLFLSLIKLVFGLVGRSPALFADGIHSLSDLICDFLILIASRYSRVDADENHPYGHHRFETFATLIIGLFLVFVGIGIAYDALLMIAHNKVEVPDKFTLVVALISILANEWLYRYTLRQAKRVQSEMLHANAEHSRGDALSSLIVLFGIAGSLAGWAFLDAVAATIIALMIFKMGGKWVLRAFHELSDAGVESARLEEIRKLISSVDGVLHMHRLRTRKMAGNIMLDVHIEIPPFITASEGHYIAEKVRITLMKAFDDITDVTVHVDVENHSESLNYKLLKSRKELWVQYEKAWSALIPTQAFKNFVLHYVGSQLKIILLLEYSWYSSLGGAEQAALIEKLHHTIKADPDIRELTIQLLVDPGRT